MYQECKNCQCSFADTRVTIHHCRACGDGFCDDCSTKQLPVPERGWGDEAVRVCDSCYEQRTSHEEIGKYIINIRHETGAQTNTRNSSNIDNFALKWGCFILA